MKHARPYVYAIAAGGLGLSALAFWFCGGRWAVVEILTRQVESETAEHESRANEGIRSWLEVAAFAGDGEDRRPVRVVVVAPPLATVENDRGKRLEVLIGDDQAPEVGEFWFIRGSHQGPALDRHVPEETE